VESVPVALPPGVAKIENAIDGVVSSFIFAIGLSFIPASLITFSVKEREEKIKHQQLVSGVGIFSYWASSYFVDFLKALLPSLFGIAMVFAFAIETFTE